MPVSPCHFLGLRRADSQESAPSPETELPSELAGAVAKAVEASQAEDFSPSGHGTWDDNGIIHGMINYSCHKMG